LTDLQLRAIGAASGSLALLLAAFGFQIIGGLAPCPLCLWQRWPHAVAVILGFLILVFPARWIAAVGALAMITGAGIGLWHAGIELKWWPGPGTCTAPVAGDMDPGELLDQILAAPVVLCDEVAWSLLGISMAGWNAIASAVLAFLWLRAYASSSASQ
jgi:disulfide bond formation protein DsbB